MSDHSIDTNADIWKSDQVIANWVASAEDREPRRAEPRPLMADLLPFTHEERFTFVDLGAGTGAAAQAILDRYRGVFAVLADYSPQMLEESTRALAAYQGRCRFVEFDL